MPRTALLIMLLVTSSAHADGAGLALYGMAHPSFDCGSAYAAFDQRPEISISVLSDGTFGQSTACFEAFAADGRTRAIQVHALNGSGLRNGRLQPSEVLYGYTLKTFRSALLSGDSALTDLLYRHFERVKSNYIDKLQPHTACYLSPILEHNLTPFEWVLVARIATEVIGGRCSLVYNPVGGNEPRALPPFISEGHGLSPRLYPPCIYDNDGKDVTHGKRQMDKYAFCEPRFYWRSCFNGRKGMRGWVAPMERTGWCSANDWRLAKEAMQ